MQSNRQFKTYVGLAGAICGSLLLGIPAIAQINPRNQGQTPATGEMCVPNSDSTTSSQGTSSANSNRNTPTTGSATSNMGGSQSTSSATSNRNTTTTDRAANDTDIESRTRQGTSSANSNRNVPIERTEASTESSNETSSVSQTTPSGTVQEQSSTRIDRSVTSNNINRC